MQFVDVGVVHVPSGGPAVQSNQLLPKRTGAKDGQLKPDLVGTDAGSARS